MAPAERMTVGGFRPAPLLSVRSVCRWLGKGRSWVMGMIYGSIASDGQGPWRVVKIGRDWRIEEASVRAWLVAAAKVPRTDRPKQEVPSRTKHNEAQPRNDRPSAS